MDEFMNVTPSLNDKPITQNSSISDLVNHNPVNWSMSDVATWLSSCGLKQYASAFEENTIDGGVLMDEDFDETTIKELIPNIKDRLLFSKERKKLRENKLITSQSTLINLPENSKTYLQKVDLSASSSFSELMDNEMYSSVRTGIKAQCKWELHEHKVTRLDIAELLHPWTSTHIQVIQNALNAGALDIFKKIFGYICIKPESDGFDSDLNIIIDEAITSEIIFHNITHSCSLKSYILDSLKRYHSLFDIMDALSSCLNAVRTNSSMDAFLDIIEQITKYILIICTIESLSSDSQRFLGNMIRKNGLPIPLAYYTLGTNGLEFKINFNTLAETFCFSSDRIILYFGSPTSIGLGKTSILPYLFENIRSEMLNTDGNLQFRSSCIDAMFASFTKTDSYIVFDIHGTMTTINEDLITAIQQYSSMQILFVTEADLQNRDFLLKTMNYSTETRMKPTIVVVFDSKYDVKSNSSCETFQQAFAKENWLNTFYIRAPILSKSIRESKFNEERRLKLLRNSLMETFRSTLAVLRAPSNFESIFMIQAHFIKIKSTGNAPPPSLYMFEIHQTLESLFKKLSDKTDNLKLVTPITYLESAKLKCEKELSQLWEQSSADLNVQLEEIRKQYQSIDQIPQYTMFFIDLLVKHPYIELLIAEKYLELWRAQYEKPLLSQLNAEKEDAYIVMSRIKQLEEQCALHINKGNEAEVENIRNQIILVKEDYKAREHRIIKIENQLSNIDLTIGLFCDEIFALYEHLPKLFESNNLSELLAKTFVDLMYKGFSFHILRGRPLRCHSKLIQLSLNHIHQSFNKSPIVLTVIGEQSSAKSSLMNATFGCNFRVSAGRCTIGMHLSVVRWQSHPIVIFDTEGLLSLEESGSIFDNQMVSMAMLTSHMVLVNHKGELSANLEHLVGMSFYAKLQIRSPLKPKLLFILRDQSDTNAMDIFIKQLAKFKENLYSDCKFLKSSIDDEFEINERNIILLPNAFSSDYNSILEIEQTWRNRTFPMKINELRKIISMSLFETGSQIYHDVRQLYQKIVSNWDAIDNLGPNLLACKTLYELSMKNELREIARGITENCIKGIHNQGRQHITKILSEITPNNCSQLDITHFSTQFYAAMQTTHRKIMEEASNDYNSKTQRSCFPPEIKEKVAKLIEPPILNMQGLLRAEFEECLHKRIHDARVSNAQHRLIGAVQEEFDRNINLNTEQSQVRIDKVYQEELERFTQTIRSESEAPDQIELRVIKFYNSDLSIKAANATTQSVYNLLHTLDVNQFQKRSQELEEIYQCVRSYTQPKQPSNISFLRRLVNIFGNNGNKENEERIWELFYCKVESWFHEKHYNNKHKKRLLKIVEGCFPQLRDDITQMIRAQRSSDPCIISHTLTYIQNFYNNEIIVNERKHLVLHHFLLDVAVIALRKLIEEIIKTEQHRHEKDIEKARNDLATWRENLKTQIDHMHNSFEQGKNMATIMSEEIFNETGRILLDKILHDITEEIGRSQFINHDAVQNQAYQESFEQDNGEKILKYVLDINRYFRELSLREINTKFEAVIYMYMRDAEQFIIDVFNIVNDTAQQSQLNNARLIADEIEKSILDKGLLGSNVGNMFTFKGIISLPIHSLMNFKQGFKTLLDSFDKIPDRVVALTRDVKKNAYNGCRMRISRQLGCQSRCPGCGAKCSRPEPHEEELVKPWHQCECAPASCSCNPPKPQLMVVHGTPHHIAEAFFGRTYYKKHTPALDLCYQHWMTSGMYIGDDEYVSPLQKYYSQYHPDWYNNLNELATTGNACSNDIPPTEQRRAWMIVRHVLVSHYARREMVDEESYDEKLYPSNIEALPKDFEPKWNDNNYESDEDNG
ncbi:unnamed protein product [Rotaria socialis]|uniref:Uncharacterized protein n=2 Tax=Rotaria socialis TaxID=392032 RepID=A0A818SYC4_9BILA|nr:unnamed protein product [Rotaria socialis]CAF4560200.1 unnamed protein product [Rotaria socialis]